MSDTPKFSKWQTVKCVQGHPWNTRQGGNVLLEGRVYDVIDSRVDGVCILNENFEEMWFSDDRFELVVPTPTSAPYLVTNEQVYTFDVDDTLVLWSGDYMKPADDRISIVDPYDGQTVHLRVADRHVKLLQQMHGRGRHIVVWSQGGALWASAVVKALGLEKYVHMVMTKPHGYVDDLPVNAWMQNHIYLLKDEEAV